MYAKSGDIEAVLEAVREMHGEHSIVPYGDLDDPSSVGFRILDVPATFSVQVTDRLPKLHFNVQIESYPPDFDYLYHARAISLWDLLDVIKTISSGPKQTWPQM